MGSIHTKRVKLVTCIVALGTATLVLAAVPATGSATNYRTYPTCEIFASKPSADHTCVAGDGFGAVLISKRRKHFHYRFCWREPSHEHHCVRKAVRDRHRPSKVPLYNRAFRDPFGKWRLVWKHGGHVIDRDRLHVGSEGV